MDESSLEPRAQGLSQGLVIKKKENLFAAVLLGQVVSFLVALTGLISALLASKVGHATSHSGLHGMCVLAAILELQFMVPQAQTYS